MVYPITAYGHPVLRKVSEEIDEQYPDLKQLIDDMFETMYVTSGVGLAAPQIGKAIRLFVIDADPFKDEDPSAAGFKKVFINAYIEEESGKSWLFNEGCLSVPNIREDVSRKSKIKISYLDENFVEHIEEYDGLKARVIQHEYDHIEGKVFVDHLSPLKKSLLKRKLQDIVKGKVKVNYRMKFAK